MVKVDAHNKGITLHERMRRMGTTGIQGPVFLVDGELVGTTRLHDTQRRDDLPSVGPQGANVWNKLITH
ncbi:MAG: hypothetical protein GWO39_06475, partial [Gammaproteobacteria bacterium]|nr:hypothetical protein [Gammaproteobacteria bacterium]NIT63439.1 hypothetical protein [Gammaproteobacteria bacterium]NIV20267.1 hypothetical protein [Gammaproteobacteria bacterium]NIY32019.1 hypothetical protein [Gammaproteobacteria bacterium]